ncbi:MAG: MaoC family dehydratase [Halobacteriota archaeon]
MPELYFEDISVGNVWEMSTYELSKDEIVEFAERYDPQPFHLDEDAAKESIFGTLIASGWQTACIYIRLLTEGFLDNTSHMAGKRVTDLQWPRPVYPEDTLTGTIEILDRSVSPSNPERGYLDYRVTGSNQADETVFLMDLVGIFGRRPNATRR